MKKCVITIGRQCGSGGHTIGKTVAERLGIPFYDKKLVQIVAERSGLSAETAFPRGATRPIKPIRGGIWPCRIRSTPIRLN